MKWIIVAGYKIWTWLISPSHAFNYDGFSSYLISFVFLGDASIVVQIG